MATLRPNWPAGLPSPQALQTATDAMARQYVLPATMLHPVVVRQGLELAYLLSAYGLASTESQPPATPSDVTVDSPRKLPRTLAIRNRRRNASQRVKVVDAALDPMD
jgi:hypothetical protein